MALVDENPPLPPVSADVLESMPTTEHYLRQDGRTPDVLFERSAKDLGCAPVSKECYISREWQERERARLWTRVWHMACRENDIPNVGDVIEYTVGDQSVLIVRDAPDSIRALENACRHRGTTLVEGRAHRQSLSCNFHGWTWNLDGSLKHIPCRWDFPQATEQDCRLPEFRIDTWNGFVFINFDSDAPPLEDYLGPTVRRHFELWPTSQRWKAVHVVKQLPCNWKVALEAFIEDYHIFRTHPQIVPYAADCNSQYDIFDDLHGRMVTAMGVVSPHAGDQFTYQDTIDAMIGDVVADVTRDQEVEISVPQVPDGATAREVLAEFMRDAAKARNGMDLSERSDSEMLDVIQYHLFPNLVLWGGFAFPLVYRFLPAGPDPETSLFEIMIMAPWPDGVPMPPDTAPTFLGPDEPFSAATELGGLGPVYDQDLVNIPRVQKGMHNNRYTAVRLSEYQERNIRNFHLNIDSYLAE